MMKPANEYSPSFGAPPVVEMVLGVEFSDLHRWTLPYYGLFWGTIRDRYPNCTVKEPLASVVEKFSGPGRAEVSLNLPPGGIPPIRCWYSDRPSTWMLQLQRDRFIQNWRKISDNHELPSYSQYSDVRCRFEAEFLSFKEFIEVEKLGELQVRQCEMTYVNHIEPQDGKDVASLLPELLPFWSDSSSGSLLPSLPEVAVFRASYVIPDNQGRLHISIEPVFRHADAKELMQMTVTARIKPISSVIDQILPAFDLGHDWAIKGFTDFTSSKLHENWRRS